MKLTTLNYIHELLLENVKSKVNAKKSACDNYRKARNNNADNVEELNEIYNKEIESWSEARGVLREFEEHEWR